MKRKLLFVNGHLNAGGVERSLVDLVRHIDYDRFDVDLLLLEDKGDYINELPSQINLIYYDTRPAYGPAFKTIVSNLHRGNFFCVRYRLTLIAIRMFGKSAYKRLRHMLNITKHYDCAFAYRTGAVADIVANAAVADKKVCWWHHGCLQQSDDLTALKKFDCIAAVSSGVKAMLEPFFSRIAVIPNIVDSDRITEMAGCKNPYPESDTPIFITVGRIAPEKHIENVVEAARRLQAEGIKFKWYVIGNGELFDTIARDIRDSNLLDTVIMTGNIVNPYPYIKYADIMVHTSQVESQGLVLLEAMALGTPCVVTRSLGPSGFVKNGITGIMVEKDIDSLIRGIKKLYQNESFRLGIATNAQDIVLDYAPQTIISLIEHKLL